jgi:hypothetical protein
MMSKSESQFLLLVGQSFAKFAKEPNGESLDSWAGQH